MKRVLAYPADPRIEMGCLLFVLVVFVIVLVTAGMAMVIPPLVEVAKHLVTVP